MTDKELKRLRRSELLEIILMLKENEQKLIEENKKLSERLSLRQIMLEADDAIGNAAIEMDDAFIALKKSIKRYNEVLNALGAKAIDECNNQAVREETNEE